MVWCRRCAKIWDFIAFFRDTRIHPCFPVYSRKFRDGWQVCPVFRSPSHIKHFIQNAYKVTCNSACSVWLGLMGESALCLPGTCTYTHHHFQDTTLGAQTSEKVYTLTPIQKHQELNEALRTTETSLLLIYHNIICISSLHSMLALSDVSVEGY